MTSLGKKLRRDMEVFFLTSLGKNLTRDMEVFFLHPWRIFRKEGVAWNNSFYLLVLQPFRHLEELSGAQAELLFSLLSIIRSHTHTQMAALSRPHRLQLFIHFFVASVLPDSVWLFRPGEIQHFCPLPPHGTPTCSFYQ